MEIKVTVELGEKAVGLLGNLLNVLNNVPPVKTYAPGGVTVGPDHAKVNTEIKEALAETNLFTQEAGEVENAPEPVKEAPKRTRRSKAEIEADKELAAQEAEAEKAPEVKAEAPKKEVAPDFADMDEDAQLEEIKAYVTRNTKKGKSADVKALLAFMDAGRASELAPDQYEDFYDLIVRYTAGEAVDVLTGADLD